MTPLPAARPVLEVGVALDCRSPASTVSADRPGSRKLSSQYRAYDSNAPSTARLGAKRDVPGPMTRLRLRATTSRRSRWSWASDAPAPEP